jgi:2-oxoglutarate dehydrogenase E1 component
VRDIYCTTIGIEYMHIQEVDERQWLQEHFEDVSWRPNLAPETKKRIYKELVEADGFETFLNIKHSGTKRFGLDGGESTIPCLETILLEAARLGIEECVIGMPHRGRLNVLARTMGKPHVAIFSEFQGTSSKPDEVQGSGDVKYHLGASADREFEGKRMHLSLTANPSHLEAVNPVVLGKVRAKQAIKGDEPREKVMGLLMHGDAAFAGQGVVPETLDLSQLRGYRTGGTIHIIVNNQIGFTTNPVASRSTPYCTDIAKGLQCPIFHVNGDDPEAVMRVAHLAMGFKQKFKRDVVIDIFCYRRHGHNEGDEPMFTQPIMYKRIAKQPTTLQIYRDKLISEGVLSADEADKVAADFRASLESQFEAAPNYKPNKADWLEGRWVGISQLVEDDDKHDEGTAVDTALLQTVGRAISRVPEGFNVNSKLVRQLNARAKMIESGDGIDWATAEQLAYGTLLMEGTQVRLSGQDSGRGTFSHRHSVIVDQETEQRYYPLSNIAPDKQAAFEVMDSPLSEFAVLGFEYGYSLADPNTLTIWEAQFGDFANTAQAMIDQFITSGESKWLRMSGLVMLLPHGMEGQGPEHSSARLERYLQACAQDNIQVVSCTTPANFFHVLRRQVRRNFRKPLIVMSPKSILRHKLVISKLADFATGSRFRRVLGEVDKLAAADKVKRVVLCSGKVYYDLLEHRREHKIDDVAIVRIEQLYPWPRDGIARELAKYPNADVVWCQEEHANFGAWNFVMRRIEYILEDGAAGKRKSTRPIYAGRPEAASPATGSHHVHEHEQELIVEQALTWKTEKLSSPLQRIPED